MTLTTDHDLYIRGAATLVASWQEYARGSVGAALKRLDGVSAAAFASDPERAATAACRPLAAMPPPAWTC
jgi:hypothetical protein